VLIIQNANISLTGFSLPITLSDETVTNEVNVGWSRVTWGYNPWGIAGTLLANGIQMSSDIGSVSITNEINIGWGSDTWGYETWGASGLISFSNRNRSFIYNWNFRFSTFRCFNR
jgi:hypothetical protein